MPRLNLLGGAYQALSLIANAQRCVNLFQESNPPANAPTPITHYPTPGLDLLVPGPVSYPVRRLYRSSNGQAYAVIGPNVYLVNIGWTLTQIGTIPSLPTPVILGDNGLVVILVDGSAQGWAIDMTTFEFAPITDPSFYGATYVDYLDTFFVFNRPATADMYASLSEVTFDMLTGIVGAIFGGNIASGGTGYTSGTYIGVPFTGGTGTGFTANVTVTGGVVTAVVPAVEGSGYVIGDSLTSSALGPGANFDYQVTQVHGFAFDPLAIAAKSGYPDPLQGLIVMHREIWLIGQLTTEIWYDSGAADFPFQAMPGAFVEHGCIAPYSISAQDLSVFWLSQDKQGQTIVLEGSSYQARRISTNAIENEIRDYSKISDAIGFCYQEEGHVFYVLTFPAANVTWVYDKSTQLWHQRAWTDNNGYLNKHRANTVMNAYGTVVCGDWENGNIYKWDLDTYTDSGQPISRIRSMPHALENLNRVSYSQLLADMEVGEDVFVTDKPVVNLRWSDDRGKTYGNYIQQTLGLTGQYLTSVQWRRLGIARDRVFELSWSANSKTALQGVFLTTTPATT
jgi:hypothetical protein